MRKLPEQLTDERIAEIGQLNVIGKETIRDLLFTLERREKIAFIAGYRYYRQVIAEANIPYDDNAQMMAEEGYDEFKGGQI